jgi:hypothetical protein
VTLKVKGDWRNRRAEIWHEDGRVATINKRTFTAREILAHKQTVRMSFSVVTDKTECIIVSSNRRTER